MEKKSIFKTLGQEIKECILTKHAGCFVALAAAVLSIVQAIVYSFVSSQDRSVNSIVFSVLGVVFFLALSLFKKTSPLAPVALMIFDLLALAGFGGKIIDYYSTAFFAGFSLKAFFGQPFAYWYSAISFVITTVLSFVAMYLPQNKTKKKNKEEETNSENESEKV